MGATILRWFWRDGVRYRAYFRSEDGAAGRVLVVACGDRTHAVPATDTARLDDLTEEQLLALAEVFEEAAAVAVHA
jgi:hypothetical protein